VINHDKARESRSSDATPALTAIASDGTRPAVADAAETTRTAGRGLLYIAGAKIWFIVSAYAIYFVLPRLLGTPEAFGLYSTAMSTVSILNNVLIAATVQTVSKLVSEDHDRAAVTLRQGLKIQLVIGTTVAGLLLLLAPYIAEGFLKDPAVTPLLRICAAVVFSYASYAALVGSLNGRHLFSRQAGLDATFSALRTTGILGGAALGLGVIGAIGGFASAAVLILGAALVVVGVGKSGEQLPLQRWTSFMRPIWVYQAFLNGILLIDVLVLKGTLTDMAAETGVSTEEAIRIANENVGYYSAAQKFAFVPYQLMVSLTFIIFPMISKATSEGDSARARETIRGALRFALVVLVSIAAPMAGAADGVMLIAYPAEYLAGAGALSVLVLGAAAFALFVVSATALSGAGRPGTAAAIAAIGLTAVVIGNRVLVKLAGLGEDTLAAAATGTSCGMALALLCAGYLVYRRFGTFLAPLTVLRVAMAGAVAWLAASNIPHDSRIMAIVALAGGFFTFILILVLLREATGKDLQMVTNILGRGKKKSAPEN